MQEMKGSFQYFRCVAQAPAVPYHTADEMPRACGKDKREGTKMDAYCTQPGKVIADAAGILAAGVNESVLKARLWSIARNALGVERDAGDQSVALHMVKTELCTFCKDQQLISCSGEHPENCDLVHIVTAGKRA